ncbi:carboxymuconolactone decarboxylase family protein [Bacillus thermotolerans]|uniref:4-carboxymuconolactone decarboxylase n=1 Tax=Bacillus thermotolerans TaxID=1221996 RepID=A0A0F5HR88_BACTR|nr:carboxymuconolactone decarboxylase family protein [Bacillus thermotolerans]KKB33909.1 4-carboxymuconolactone decarboxylase [Bacillus thermotolerans]KKB35362.1 4-carboxymuconolactone decarboxylase [Bacillus thermotolerans]
MKSERYQKGLETLRKLTGDSSQQAIENVKAFSPDLEEMMMEFGFGDVYSRPALDLKQRALITLTSLITQGAGERQLTFHFKAAMHVGWSVEEIIEIIIQCAAYAGFPKAVAALELLKEISTENPQPPEQ